MDGFKLQILLIIAMYQYIYLNLGDSLSEGRIVFRFQ